MRARVIALADETLAALPEGDVPASLRAVRRFTPSKRARLGAAALGAALDTEPQFRRAVADRVREGLPAVADAVDAELDAAAVDAADLAAVAYVLEAPNWRARLAAVEAPPEGDGAAAEVPLAKPDESAARELRRLRRDSASARHEAADLRRRVERAEAGARRSEQARDEAVRRADDAQAARDETERRLSAQVRRLRQQVQDAEAAAAAVRRDARGDRDSATARLRVLLETVTTAAAGLRRELDLPASPVHPADLVAGGTAEARPAEGLLAALRRGRAADDPALVDDVLAVPGMHLIIDGYNVTKLGYPTLTLEQQRGRLLKGLGGLTARASGAELTCVFDGTAAVVRPVPGMAPRGLRVVFSAPDELADQLIERLTAAEPPGRPVVVVTNDRAVVGVIRRSGADALASGALLGRLERL